MQEFVKVTISGGPCKGVYLYDSANAALRALYNNKIRPKLTPLLGYRLEQGETIETPLYLIRRKKRKTNFTITFKLT